MLYTSIRAASVGLKWFYLLALTNKYNFRLWKHISLLHVWWRKLNCFERSSFQFASVINICQGFEFYLFNLCCHCFFFIFIHTWGWVDWFTWIAVFFKSVYFTEEGCFGNDWNVPFLLTPFSNHVWHCCDIDKSAGDFYHVLWSRKQLTIYWLKDRSQGIACYCLGKLFQTWQVIFFLGREVDNLLQLQGSIL